MNYFLVIFIDFFIFLNLNSNLNFWVLPLGTVTVPSGNGGNRGIPRGT
jgi:hypothetical protein